MKVCLRHVHIFILTCFKKIELAGVQLVDPTALFRWHSVSLHKGDTTRDWSNRQLPDALTDMLCSVVLCSDPETESDTCCTTNP
jgi:hypothetical protein